MSDRSETPAATPERVTSTLTPRGRRAMDRLVAEHGKNRSTHVDNGLALLIMVRDAIPDDGTAYLAIVRGDGPPERVHVP